MSLTSSFVSTASKGSSLPVTGIGDITGFLTGFIIARARVVRTSSSGSRYTFDPTCKNDKPASGGRWPHHATLVGDMCAAQNLLQGEQLAALLLFQLSSNWYKIRKVLCRHDGSWPR